MQKSSVSTNEMIPLWGIILSLVFLNLVIILQDFYSSFRFIVSILKSFLGVISYIWVPSNPKPPTTQKICRNGNEILNDGRDLSFSELKRVMEKAGMSEIGGLFEEEEPSLMEVKEAFDVLDENKDGFIDAKELRNALISLGLMEEASEDDCKTMIKGFDDNCDGRIDFNKFARVLETSFCF
ncbi:hypothetical protein E1A91_D12G204000v1 [Gossypium mustelinum]|uniref:EF-hand domain-containing protein n=4 Tax=Gossypium TaxID=3633 RepID=A0A5J5P1D1_GOSBA|nr:hypothetical protein ES319_D12G201200v1 [Gossypium barbadense]PPD78928.1 hypothetical protein GOBAR_DD24143 [Gossypium barbadense]TYG41885.1 hypothetical protein ES288_D12G212500v1 [Gossypium darwinii]TYH39942.1 hypothetical protein ES332_D12G212600v1 [Gossypium tomentosum]TYI51825.1 hypothetical protein E1A91_D12G204000v1 [Gossypium mustelinum]